MSTLDIIIVIILLLAAYRGYKNGLLKNVFTLAGIVLGIVLGFKLLDMGMFFLSKHLFIQKSYLPLAAFLIIFLITYLIVFFVGRSIKGVLNYIIIGTIDSIIGACIALIKILFLLSMLAWVVSLAPINIIVQYTTGSVLYPYILNFVPVVFKNISFILPLDEILQSIKYKIEITR